jgi:hypothetical protein
MLKNGELTLAKKFGKVFVNWVGWKGKLFGSGFRFNGGGYLYGAAPYEYWRFGPIMIKKYM